MSILLFYGKSFVTHSLMNAGYTSYIHRDTQSSGYVEVRVVGLLG